MKIEGAILLDFKINCRRKVGEFNQTIWNAGRGDNYKNPAVQQSTDIYSAVYTLAFSSDFITLEIKCQSPDFFSFGPGVFSFISQGWLSRGIPSLSLKLKPDTSLTRLPEDEVLLS